MGRNAAPLRALLVVLALAAFAVEAGEAGPLARNLVVDVGLAAIVVSSLFRVGRARDLPLPRGKLWEIAPPAIAAAAACAPTLALPYLSDDLFLLHAGRISPTPMHAVLPEPNAPFFRPAARVVWWILARVSPDDATLAHAVSAAAFAAAAVLLGRALRRSGVPRGVAVAAATVYAASPIAVETVAWASNLYSTLSALGFFAALATLPLGRAPARRYAAPALFALLAFFSKEDSFSLPLMAFVVGARWRLRGARIGARCAAPIAVALALACAARIALLGGVGGYRDPETGASVHAARWIRGPSEALKKECPAGYFVPKRRAGHGPPWRSAGAALRLAPALLLALGGAGAAARRHVPRALAMTAICLAPVATVIPVGPDLANARQLLLPAAGIAFVAAALLAGAPGGGAVRWGATALYAALSIAVGRSNFGPWRDVGAAFESGVESTKGLLAGAPPNAVALLDGYPDSVAGALCFRNAFVYAFPRASGRPDLEIRTPLDSFESADLLIDFDARARAARRVDALEPAIRIGPGEARRVALTAGSPERPRCRLRDADGYDVERGWSAIARWYGAAVVLPDLEVPTGARLEVRVEEAAGASTAAPIATYRDRIGWRRVALEDGAIALPHEVSRVRIEIPIPVAAERVLRAVTLTSREP